MIIRFSQSQVLDAIERIVRKDDCYFVISSSQCRAARGLLHWSQQELASRAGIGVVTVNQLENEVARPRRATLQVIKRAFEAAGVEFIDENGGGPGVRLRSRQHKTRHGL
jgi:transcriptional regulator with XRE-family HTH domain